MTSLPIHNASAEDNNHPLASQYTYVGIDFGTSTTVVSLIDASTGVPSTRPLPIVQKDRYGGQAKGYKVPTCIAFSNQYQEIYCGNGAYDARFDSRVVPGKNVWFEFKTLLGEDVGPRYTESMLDGKDGRPVLETATDAATIFLSYIRKEVEKEIKELGLPHEIKYIVSVPASFEANQRQDLLIALRRAGIAKIDESMLIDEPNAAFLSYLEQNQRAGNTATKLVIPEDDRANLMVFDFGAGTCDISILQISKDEDGRAKSKNLAISHYTEIGGKDLDREIAMKLLSEAKPEELNAESIAELSGQSRRKMIQQLLRIAESLKVELCKNVQFVRSAGRKVDEATLAVNSGVTTTLKDLKNKVYQLLAPTLTYGDFDTIMRGFTGDCGSKSIMIPVNSALASAGLESEDISYVLMVGGSAQNPWIQDSLKKAFVDSEFLYPADMQSLVSEGAALHSYYLHALGQRLIHPITGPTIKLRLANGEMQTLVPSGTEIPFTGNELHGFSPQREGQMALELPICLTSEDYILQVLNIESTNAAGFSIRDKISLAVKISVDKTLHVAARVSTGEAVVTQLNPYSSKALNTRERIAAEARKQFNATVRKRGGEPLAYDLVTLSQALAKADERLEAAEAMDEAYGKDPSSVSLNNLAVAWSNAGRNDKAMKYFEIAVEKGDLYAMVNLAANLRSTDPGRYETLLTKAYNHSPANDWVCYNYGELLKSREEKGWEDIWQKALAVYMDRLAGNTLEIHDANRAQKIATALKRTEESRKIKDHLNKLNVGDTFFTEEHTIRHAAPDLSPVRTS